MDGLPIQMDDLGVPLFQETTHFGRVIPYKSHLSRLRLQWGDETCPDSESKSQERSPFGLTKLSSKELAGIINSKDL